MIDEKRVLAVIPARGGSKRCPRKNIKPFRGKPLLAWTVEEARKSKYIDHLVVSTEDEEIAGVALEAGASVLMRPHHLATDDAKSEDVLRHANGLYDCDMAVLLQPTSPLRTAQDIDACIQIAAKTGECHTCRPDGTKNGAVYVAAREWLAVADFALSATRHVMPEERSLDIDYAEQFEGVS